MGGCGIGFHVKTSGATSIFDRVLDSFGMDPPLLKAESISNAGGASEITYLLKGKKCCMVDVRELKNVQGTR